MNPKAQKRFLLIIFSTFFVLMLVGTIRASLVRSVFDNSHLMGDVWFQATLLDAYLGFFTFFVWVAWKEPTYLRRLIWLALIMTLGNMAMAGYVLWQVIRLPPEAGMVDLLTQPNQSKHREFT